jgi:hypothetical protein
MYNSCQKFICPPDNTAAKYTTSYILHSHDDGQQYLVLQDYQLDLVPGYITIELGICSTETKCWVSWQVAYCKIRPQQRVDTDNVCLSVSGNADNKHVNDNWCATLNQTGPKSYQILGQIIHRIFSQAATTVPYKDIFNDRE